MLELFLVELKRTWTEFIRYPVEAISGIFITAFIFYGLFISTRYIAGSTLFGDRLDAIVVGYVLWTLVTFIIQSIAFGLQIEAQTGTLEQLFLSPYGTLSVFLVRTLASLTLHIAMIVCILLLTILLTGRSLHFPSTLFLPLITLLLGAYGLALMMGALGLLFKRIQQMFALVQFALLFLLTAPTETWSGLLLQVVNLLLPMTISASVLRDLMARNQSLNFYHLAFALLNGVGYFALGNFIFRWAERKAKREGLLTGY